jgi:hypothetical protein
VKQDVSLVSTNVALRMLVESGKPGLFTGKKTPFVPPGHNESKEEKWCPRQDLNPETAIASFRENRPNTA